MKTPEARNKIFEVLKTYRYDWFLSEADVDEILEQYADEVSRERAVEFANDYEDMDFEFEASQHDHPELAYKHLIGELHDKWLEQKQLKE